MICALSACSRSYDLGAEKFAEEDFGGAEPSWQNGIGNLMKKKCANCHIGLSSRSDFVPSTTPTTINAISTSSFFDSETYAGLVYDRVFVTTTRPMPPNYATPLSDGERAALKTWLQTKVATYESLCGSSGSSALAYADVAATISENCTTCHTGGTRQEFNTLAKTAVNRRTMLTYLKAGTMPPSSSTFKDTAAGAALFNWLCFGADIQ